MKHTIYSPIGLIMLLGLVIMSRDYIQTFDGVTSYLYGADAQRMCESELIEYVKKKNEMN